MRIAAICFVLAPMLGFAQSPAPDAQSIMVTVQRFHEALAKGDRSSAMELLAPDAVILESGVSQTREEYAHEHLAEDIAFAQATKSTLSDFVVRQDANVAWTTAISNTSGTFKAREVTSVGVELMVLSKSESGWRIRAIHWSSHKEPTARP